MTMRFAISVVGTFSLQTLYLVLTWKIILQPERKQRPSINAAQFLPIPDQQMKDLQLTTAANPTLQTPKKIILNGFPESKESLPVRIHPYFGVRDELSRVDGITFKGLRCVVPVFLRHKVPYRRTRTSQNSQRGSMSARYEYCLSTSASQIREPLISHEVPDRPWKKVATDIFTLDSKDFPCTVDYYNGYFEVDFLSSKTSKSINTKLKKHFATHGIPNELHIDNGPPFNSIEFATFVRFAGVEHIKSLPLHPQSNERAENLVKTAKNLVKKGKEVGIKDGKNGMVQITFSHLFWLS